MCRGSQCCPVNRRVNTPLQIILNQKSSQHTLTCPPTTTIVVSLFHNTAFSVSAVSPRDEQICWSLFTSPTTLSKPPDEDMISLDVFTAYGKKFWKRICANEESCWVVQGGQQIYVINWVNEKCIRHVSSALAL